MVNFTRFEYFAYQQWCVPHEGFTFNDLTDQVGSATWGSYLESPDKGARLVHQKPMWVSGVAMARSKNKSWEIEDWAPAEPLPIFHIDHKEGWSEFVNTGSYMKMRGVKR